MSAERDIANIVIRPYESDDLNDAYEKGFNVGFDIGEARAKCATVDLQPRGLPGYALNDATANKMNATTEPVTYDYGYRQQDGTITYRPESYWNGLRCDVARPLYDRPMAAQPQEPVGHAWAELGEWGANMQVHLPNGTPLYAAPLAATASPEPVAWMTTKGSVCAADNKKKPSAHGNHDNYTIPLYTTPQAQPPYPKGIVNGPCVCGSWPGGECFKCEWRPAAFITKETTK